MSKMKGWEAQMLLEVQYEGCMMDELEKSEHQYDKDTRNAYYNKYILRKVKQ